MPSHHLKRLRVLVFFIPRCTSRYSNYNLNIRRSERLFRGNNGKKETLMVRDERMTTRWKPVQESNRNACAPSSHSSGFPLSRIFPRPYLLFFPFLFLPSNLLPFPLLLLLLPSQFPRQTAPRRITRVSFLRTQHARLYFFHGGTGGSGGGRRRRGRGGVESGDFGFGKETLFFKTDFTAAFVAIPEDEEKDCGR